MKILTMKATDIHYNGMLPHCHGSEKTLISCFSPEPVISTCYYLLVECRSNYIMSSTQTPVITPSNTPLPTDMSDTGMENGGVPIAVVAGVIGAMVVIIIGLILLVVVLIVVLSRKNKDYKNSSTISRYIIQIHYILFSASSSVF